MTIAAELKVLLTSLAVAGAAFATERMFVPHIVPVAWADEPQPLWAVEAAFLLRAVENIAATLALIACLVLVARWIGRWLRRPASRGARSTRDRRPTPPTTR